MNATWLAIWDLACGLMTFTLFAVSALILFGMIWSSGYRQGYRDGKAGIDFKELQK